MSLPCFLSLFFESNFCWRLVEYSYVEELSKPEYVFHFNRSYFHLQVQVHSLGWVELREDELTPENSSKAVNRCIVQLAPANSAPVDPAPPPASVVGQWGEGKELTLELNEGSLRLIDSKGMTVNSQAIHSIRVWGVGRDNGQDFAYVARDR